MTGRVIAVSLSTAHSFNKSNRESIELLAGLGIAGDAHCGNTVQHRSRVAKDPTQPNLRQVHLIHSELHDELKTKGFDLFPGHDERVPLRLAPNGANAPASRRDFEPIGSVGRSSNGRKYYHYGD